MRHRKTYFQTFYPYIISNNYRTWGPSEGCDGSDGNAGLWKKTIGTRWIEHTTNEAVLKGIDKNKNKYKWTSAICSSSSSWKGK